MINRHISGLQQQLAKTLKMIFGSRQERFIPTDPNTAQLSLGIDTEAVAACSVTQAKKISYTRTQMNVEEKPLSHPGRMRLPEHIRREEIVIEPDEDTSTVKGYQEIIYHMEQHCCKGDDKNNRGI